MMASIFAGAAHTAGERKMIETTDDVARVHSHRRVATYRVQFLDATGQIARPTIMFEASDDFTAIDRAHALVGDTDHIDIWEGSRRVGPTLAPQR